MQIKIITVGKLKEAYFLKASQEYEKRISPFSKITVTEVEPAFLKSNPTSKEIEDALNAEAFKIKKAIPNGAYIISLCIEGEQISSEALATKLENIMQNNGGKICFIIGGSYGLSDQIKNLSNYKFSMSKLTFPHRLARVILLEQLYRSFKIINGAKYHK